MRWRYKGPDDTLGKLGKIGHGSIIELDRSEVLEIGGTLFEEVALITPISIAPFGLNKYEPDVTGLTQSEVVEANLKRAQNKEAREREENPLGIPDKDREALQDNYRTLAKETAKSDEEAAKFAAEHPLLGTVHAAGRAVVPPPVAKPTPVAIRPIHPEPDKSTAREAQAKETSAHPTAAPHGHAAHTAHPEAHEVTHPKTESKLRH